MTNSPFRDTSHATELAHAAVTFPSGSEGRIERMRFNGPSESGMVGYRFSWWSDGQIATLPLDVAEDELLSLLKNCLEKRVFSQRFVAGLNQLLMTESGPARGIDLPRDIMLPFFAYGSLKPGEPAHYQIKTFLARDPVSSEINGEILVRDGLPLLKVGGQQAIHGSLLHFKPESASLAYETICRFEPRKQYFWKESIRLRAPEVDANVLVGKQLGRGRAEPLEAKAWTMRDDPVFSYGLDVVSEVIGSDACAKFEFEDWPRFFRLQMAYLLLWSAVERYTSLLLGAALDPMVRIKQFGKHEVFRAAFQRAEIDRDDKVCDSRDPKDSFTLDPSDPSTSILYYYQVRNNLSHRGKGAWADGEIVRQSLRELQAIFKQCLVAGAQEFAGFQSPVAANWPPAATDG